jgi:hypothetical protein
VANAIAAWIAGAALLLAGVSGLPNAQREFFIASIISISAVFFAVAFRIDHRDHLLHLLETNQ